MSMDEDAMFKALLKNKPQQKAQTEQKAEVSVKKDNAPKAASGAISSEDAMYKALLKNKPQQSVSSAQKTPVRTGGQVQNIHSPDAENTYVKEEPVIETKVTPNISQSTQTVPVNDSINNLTTSVDKVYGLLKTAIIILVLILLVGLAILIKP